MEGLLDAANVTPDKFTIGELPVESGEVSIMTLEQAYEALGGDLDDIDTVWDPTKGYNTSTYYMYAINDFGGANDSISNSTLANLQSVDIDWYRQLNKPTTNDDHWAATKEGTHLLFGGPLRYINRWNHDTYTFGWHYSESERARSNHIRYWGDDVSCSVYVVVVHS